MQTNPTANSRQLVRDTDLATLEEGRKLNDQVLNHYLALLDKRDLGEGHEKKVFGLDTFFLPSLRRGRSLADRRFRHKNPFDFDLLLTPVHVEARDHWALIAAWPKLKRMQAFDSLHYPHKTDLYRIFFCLKREAKRRDVEMDTSAWHLQDTCRSDPRQTNGYDCGVFTLWFAERLTRGEEIRVVSPPFDPTTWRDHIRLSLSQGAVILEEAILAEKGLPPLPDSHHVTSENPGSADPATSGSASSRASLSPYTSWESLLESLELVTMGTEEPETDNALPPSPCLSCSADEGWLEDELREAMEELAPPRPTNPPEPQLMPTTCPNDPTTPPVVESMEVDEPGDVTVESHSSNLLEDDNPTKATDPLELESKPVATRTKPKRPAKRKKVLVHFPWGPMKMDHRFVRPDCFGN